MGDEKQNFDSSEYIKVIIAITITLFYLASGVVNAIDLHSKYMHISIFTSVGCAIIGGLLVLYLITFLYEFVTKENEIFGVEENGYNRLVNVNGTLVDKVNLFLRTVGENTTFITIQLILGAITFAIFLDFWIKFGGSTIHIFKTNFINFAKLQQFQIWLIAIAVAQSIALYYYLDVLCSQLFSRPKTLNVD